MVDLMPATEIFGANTDDSVAWLSEHHPAALARRIERERGRGKPVQWEATALKQMLRWKDARLVKGGSKVPRTLATLDTAAESFITIFNCLHDLEPKRREDMLRGLTPEDVFNAVVGGEAELYRLGTSSYRDHLHGVIMRGIRASGSFETFIDKAIPRHLGDAAVNASGSRALMFLRVVSSFGLLEEDPRPREGPRALYRRRHRLACRPAPLRPQRRRRHGRAAIARELPVGHRLQADPARQTLRQARHDRRARRPQCLRQPPLGLPDAHRQPPQASPSTATSRSTRRSSASPSTASSRPTRKASSPIASSCAWTRTPTRS